MWLNLGPWFAVDPALLWLWRRPAATAPVGSPAWEPPYAAGAAPEKAKAPPQKKVYSEAEIQVIFECLLVGRKGLIFWNIF